MKISVIGNRRHYNLEDYAVRALENLGHEVQFLGYNEINGRRYSELLRMVTTRSAVIRRFSEPYWLDAINEKYMLSLTKFQPEIVLSIKGESVLPRTLTYLSRELGTRSALWSPDDPRFFRSLFRYIAPHYDYVFSYSSHGTELYKDLGIEGVHRMTFGCDSNLHRRENWDNSQKNRALFVGTFTPNRFRIIKSLIRNGIKVDIAGRHWKQFLPANVISEGIYGRRLSKAFHNYKISINMHNDERYGPNMRTFEVTGSGGTLMTDMAEDMDKFFREGKEVFIYQDVGELMKLIKDRISDDEHITEVARNGYRRSHNSYTYDKVMGGFLRTVSSKS